MLSKPTWLRGKTVAVWDIFATMGVKEVRRYEEKKSCQRGRVTAMFRGGCAAILKRGSVLFVDGSFGLAAWRSVALIHSGN